MTKCRFLIDEVCCCAESSQCADFPSERYCNEICKLKVEDKENESKEE